MLNVGELRTEIRAVIDHLRLPTSLDNIVRLCEGEINARARFNDQVKKVSLSSNSNGEIDLPADYLETVSVMRLSPTLRYALDPISDDEGQRTLIFRDRAERYAITGQKMQLYPIEEGVTVSLSYYAAIPTLAGKIDSETNWLLTKYPQIYFYGCLFQADSFVRKEERQPLWAQSFLEGIDVIRRREYKARFPDKQPLTQKLVVY